LKHHASLCKKSKRQAGKKFMSKRAPAERLNEAMTDLPRFQIGGKNIFLGKAFKEMKETTFLKCFNSISRFYQLN
jgi:hypothetical protein